MKIGFRTLTVAAMVALGILDLPLEGQQPARERAESFMRALESGDFAGATALVGPRMKQAGVTEAMLRATWQQISGGQPVVSLRVTNQVSAQGYDVVDVVVKFASGEQGWRVSVDSELRVEGLRPFAVQPPAYHAPAYVDTTAFEEAQLTVGAEGWPLGATLTLPRGVARAPVVVLVHGSGAHDRDETIGPSMPFRDLAWGLASRGLAVLRYEKRNWKHGARMVADGFTIEDEVIADALAALAQVRTHARIDSNRVFLLGHSLGGMVGPEIAARDGRLAGLVLMAGSPRQLPQIVVEQLDYLKTQPVNAAPAAQEQLTSMRELMVKLQARAVPPAADAMGAPASYFYDLAERSAARFLPQVKAPILVLQGGRDYQITETDYAEWQRLLRGRDNAHFEWYPDLNHLFAVGEGRATPAEYGQEQHVAERVIDDIARFAGVRR